LAEVANAVEGWHFGLQAFFQGGLKMQVLKIASKKNVQGIEKKSSNATFVISTRNCY